MTATLGANDREAGRRPSEHAEVHAWRRLFVHLVWGTWDRAPLITEAVDHVAFGTITSQGRRLRCEVLAIDGVSDHTHVLVSLSPQTDITTLVRAMKSASTVEVRRAVSEAPQFKWQHGYAALSVSPDAAPAVIDYVKSQKSHHAGGTTHSRWEPPLNELDVDD